MKIYLIFVADCFDIISIHIKHSISSLLVNKRHIYFPFLIQIRKSMVKELTKAQVDDLIRLKFGRIVSTPYHTQYASNSILGKIFGMSGSKVRQIYMQRFQEIKD